MGALSAAMRMCQLSVGNAFEEEGKCRRKERTGLTAERRSAMRLTTECEGALLVGTAEGVRLIGGATGIWNRCLAAGWIRPAICAGPIHYYRYGDIAALAERLCRERPPRLIANGRKELLKQ